MQIDAGVLPFSRYGSYVSVLHGTGSGRLRIRNAHDNQEADLFTVAFSARGIPVAFDVTVAPGVLTVAAAEGGARLWLHGDGGLVIDADGLDVELSPTLGLYGFGYVRRPGELTLQPALHQVVTRVDVPVGQVALTAEWPAPAGFLHCSRADVRVTPAGGRSRTVLRMSEYDDAPPLPDLDAEAEIAATRRDWERFLAGMPAVPDRFRGSAELAWYTMWLSVVRARGMFAYDAMLMSKHKMFQVWSWDHCFNALALVRADPAAALEQFQLPFRRQLPTGELPDSMSDTRLVTTFTKPPIHGWCLSRLLRHCDPPHPVLRNLRDGLARWTRWWFEHRDFDRDGLPCYAHSNDSGWDNNTLADAGVPVESPDLAAYLILQMHALADLEDRLGDPVAAADWRERADRLRGLLLDALWTPTGFVARASGSHDSDPHPTSLLVLMPLVLGDLLPDDKRAVLVARLERDFLAPGGPATEALSSPKHVGEGEGYGMRGPIWASITYLLVDGLDRGGHRQLAARIARGFCEMVDRSRGMYENYEARSGAGRHVPGYTWTAAVHVLLLHEYVLDADDRAGDGAARRLTCGPVRG